MLFVYYTYKLCINDKKSSIATWSLVASPWAPFFEWGLSVATNHALHSNSRQKKAFSKPYVLY